MTGPVDNKEHYQGVLSTGETPGQKDIKEYLDTEVPKDAFKGRIKPAVISDEEWDLIKAAYAKVQPVLACIENENFHNLITNFIDMYGPRFCQEPASAKYHHSYDGGLFDHSYETFEIARQVAVLYPSINKDVLFTGAFLHDCGKMRNYSEYILKSGKRSTATPFKRSDYSRVLDHIGEGMIIIQKLAMPLDISVEDVRHLLHIVGSHHGEVRRGWGSIVDPGTPEAHIVHHSDMISSRVK